METWRATEGAKYGIGSNIILLKMLTVILAHGQFMSKCNNLIRFMTSIFFLSAIYNFNGQIKHGLLLDVGDAVQIFESCAGM